MPCWVYASAVEVTDPVADCFDWQSHEEVKSVQNENSGDRTRNAALINGLYNINNRIWILENAHEVKLRSIVRAQYRQAGNCGANATMSIIKERCTWRSVKANCNEFVQQCFHCISESSV